QFPAVSSSFSLPSSVLLSQNQRAVFCDGDAVLKVSAVAAVLGDRGPLVVQQLGARLADVHHGLDGQHHAFAQLRSLTAIAEVRNLRLFVQLRTDAVTDELANHAETRGFHAL